MIEKIPTKKIKPEIIIELREELSFKKEDAAALKASEDILNKLTKLESATLPPSDRNTILSNLKKVVKKSERIVNKLIR